MGSTGEAGRRGSAGGAPAVSAADRAALELAQVGEDIQAILGPSPRRSSGERAARLEPLDPGAQPSRRRLGLIVAAAVGCAFGGVIAFGVLSRGPEPQGMRAMIALAPGFETAPAPAAPSLAAAPSSAAKPPPAAAPAALPPVAAPAPLPVGPARLALNAPSPRLRPAARRGQDTADAPAPPPPAVSPVHAASAALSALSEAPEVFYAGPAAPERTSPRPACAPGDPHCGALAAALLADRRVRLAYAEASAAGVGEDVLSGFRRSWADTRERLSERPGELVLEYGRLADALVRARDRARARADDADARPRGSSDR